ncbi:helix-turn-helix domain-containing protein [Gordonia sp. C13]|uniref:helix-turn-helix domain-containing protein n=1 Tax=Gordonia sp. C13 TaxID=2935078 RepID=UPI00200ADA7B|nr:XRE family transcriptional regulator [Gordonia sp. C13]MCK8613822.1 XRE family transcriptional regulator [Gordonia sp. C13]
MSTPPPPSEAPTSGPDDAEQLGAEVRRNRKKRSMTLGQLAEQTGLSIGFLSLVERGRTNPSFTSLLRIAGALNIPMSALMPGPDQPADESSPDPGGREPHRHAVHPSGVYRDRYITPENAKTIQVLEAILEPGDRSRVAPYKHSEEEELILVLDGELEFDTGDTTRLLRAGEALLIDPRIPHSYRNPGKVAVRWLWISATA